MTFATDLRNRAAELVALRRRIDNELRGINNGLVMAGEQPLDVVLPGYEFTPDEMRAAHRLHLAGSRGPWVNQGERAYQRGLRDGTLRRLRRPNNEQPPCGTDAAYHRHRAHGEPIDDACREGHNAARRRAS